MPIIYKLEIPLMALALYDNPITLDRELYRDGYITTRASKSGVDLKMIPRSWEPPDGASWLKPWEDGQIQGDWRALGDVLDTDMIDNPYFVG